MTAVGRSTRERILDTAFALSTAECIGSTYSAGMMRTRSVTAAQAARMLRIS